MNIPNTTSKDDVFKLVQNEIQNHNFKIATIDDQRPWGGFIRFEETEAPKFQEIFFPEAHIQVQQGQILTPKILIVAPNARLSWQYHYRRQEVWKVLHGPVQVMTSDTDEQTQPEIYQTGELIQIGHGTRHRLIGDTTWGIVAEIWQHTDTTQPSDEDDIVRVQDDYGR